MPSVVGSAGIGNTFEELIVSLSLFDYSLTKKKSTGWLTEYSEKHGKKQYNQLKQLIFYVLQQVTIPVMSPLQLELREDPLDLDSLKAPLGPAQILHRAKQQTLSFRLFPKILDLIESFFYLFR